MLDVLYRSQRARVCELKVDGGSVTTPSVIGSSAGSPVRLEDGRRLRAFGSAAELDLKLDIPGMPAECQQDIMVVRGDIPGTVPDNVHTVAVPNGFELRGDFRRMLDTLVRLRTAIGYRRVLYVSGIAEPSNLALLSYLGVDMFDDVLCRALGRKGIRCIPEGQVRTGEDETGTNLSELERECLKVRDYIAAGRLRELVDQRAPSSPFGVAALRTFDRDHFGYQEEACPTAGGRFACNTTQSLFRPEVRRFRERMASEYRKPSHKKVLVLLPCSAKKPYHSSRSHRAFASALHTGPHDIRVHEVIVTSPLGAVPRELDVFFPANSYDIPVTGEWKCQEREFIRHAVKGIIDQGYDKVISHLGQDTSLISGLADMTETCAGDPISPASLKRLEEEVRKASKGYGEVSYTTDRTETLRSLLSYQFGRGTADILTEGSHAAGRFPYWKLFRGGTQLGMVTPERQMLSLTMEGAETLAAAGGNIVEMTDFELRGNLFAVGVVRADPSLRIGDEAVIVRDGRVMAVGVAQMSGREMTDLDRGIAVKVRHRAK